MLGLVENLTSPSASALAACVLMQKNERELLPRWIEHHGRLFGFENLHIFDNGSDSDVVDYLRYMEHERGLHVDYSHTEPVSFSHKGSIIARRITELSGQAAASFYFPLDCDEFLGVWTGREYSCRPADIHRELQRCPRDIPCSFEVASRRDNCPWDDTVFYEVPRAGKLFFANTQVEGLDLGFHECRRPYVSIGSRIVYFHFHFKPHELLVAHAREKLKTRLPLQDISREELLSYRGPGYHLTRYLTHTEDEIHAWLDSHPNIRTDAVAELFAGLELDFPFSDELERLRSLRAEPQTCAA